MTTRATCTFDITTWEPEEYDDQDGVKLTRTRVAKAFHGDLEGQSTAELLMAGAPGGSAVYVGLERIEGRLNGRLGSFVLIHNASMASDEQSLSLTIMRDSGTGELHSIGGEGNITIDPDGDHTFTLDFDLG
jgi:Protein of unknown function (DUF3224)